MVEASSFIIHGPISSSPIALCGSTFYALQSVLCQWSSWMGRMMCWVIVRGAVGFHAETHSQIDDLVHQPSLWGLQSFFHFL